MTKNVLVISTSMRKGGNSDSLADSFAKGAAERGNTVEKISLIGKKIGFCIGCLSCQKTQKCVLKDDAAEIVEKMKNADVIAFATPIYYYEMAGQMKTLLDRANPLYPSNYKFRDIYLLASSAEDDGAAMDRAVVGLQGWIECFPKCGLKGVVRGTGVEAVGDIAGKPVLDEAFEMGKNV